MDGRVPLLRVACKRGSKRAQLKGGGGPRVLGGRLGGCRATAGLWEPVGKGAKAGGRCCCHGGRFACWCERGEETMQLLLRGTRPIFRWARTTYVHT